MHRWPGILLAILSLLIAGCSDNYCPTCPTLADCPECEDCPDIPEDGVVQGDVTVFTQSQLARYVGVTEVTGRLGLGGHPAADDPIVDLSPLASLERVEILEIFQTALRDLSGLESLVEAASGLRITAADSLVSLAGLDSLQTVYMQLRDLPRLESVAVATGLFGLESFHAGHCEALEIVDLTGDWSELRELEIEYCDALIQISAGELPDLVRLEVYRCPVLGSVDVEVPGLIYAYLIDLPALSDLGLLRDAAALETLSMETVGGVSDLTDLSSATTLRSLYLREMPELQSLLGLTSATQLALLNLALNPELTSLAGLPDLTELAEVWLFSLPELTSLAGLETATGVRRLYLDDLPQVTSLAPLPAGLALDYLQLGQLAISDLTSLPAMTSCDHASIYGCQALTSLAGLEAAAGLMDLELNDNPALVELADVGASLEDLQIWNCAELASLAGLPSLPVLSTLSLHDNAALTNLVGPTYPETLTRLWLMNNGALASLDGLQGLREVATELSIRQNPALTSVAELSSLERVYNVTITENVALGDAAAFALLAGLEVTGTARVSGNHR